MSLLERVRVSSVTLLDGGRGVVAAHKVVVLGVRVRFPSITLLRETPEQEESCRPVQSRPHLSLFAENAGWDYIGSIPISRFFCAGSSMVESQISNLNVVSSSLIRRFIA